ncbi:rod-binding protein [Bosea sp. PAMC 26642]|uniref:rod-binding protein n=1 Tax=Bosea sp. (strain PAMC 26642) TaxID=1792307 RepID=UPI00076FEBEF|nr:rod-binding protein [Bosea sp. PAMC 26642]AMJ62654.1 hypothetical protein AXW83_22255 [Bosea sp. PAMC 26642]
MAISPPSDIVLDVVRAADPSRYAVAFDRLSRMGSPGSAGTQFASAVDNAAPAPAAPGLAGAREKFASLSLTTPSFAGNPAAASGVPSHTDKTLQKFEAQVISTFIEQMMPESTTNSYGSGLSGGVWRSMLSEQIAGEIAKSGGLGIRQKVMAAMAARTGSTPGTDTGGAVAAAQKVLDRTLAGANSRDAAVPLAVERQFLNITRPGPSGASRTSIT